jgi:hypothetical protein
VRAGSKTTVPLCASGDARTRAWYRAPTLGTTMLSELFLVIPLFPIYRALGVLFLE